MTNNEITGRVSFQIWDVRVAAMATLTGTIIKRTSKGNDPIYSIQVDEPEARSEANRNRPLKLRASCLTQI